MFTSNTIDRSLFRPTYDMGMFSRPSVPVYGPTDEGMGFWGNLVTGLVQAAGPLYQAKTSKDIAKSQIAHESRLASMSEETRRMEILLQQKQAELLSSSNQRTTPISKATTAIKSPVGIAAIVGGTVAIGLAIYLITKKKRRK